MLHEEELGSTFPDVACGGGNTGNKALQLANTMLRHKLQGNVARFTWPLVMNRSVYLVNSQASQAQNTWSMRQLVYIENRMGKSPIVKKCVNNYLIRLK